MWKEAIVVFLKALSQHLTTKAEEKHKISWEGWLAFVPGIKLKTSQI
jgi:hypothetical protein